MSEARKKNLLLFFDRPQEPCFMQKGNKKAIFQLPDHYFPDKYKDLSDTLSNRFGEDSGPSIPVRNISIPNLSVPMKLPYNDVFSLFVPQHRKTAGKLIDIMMGMRNVDDLTSLAAYCQLRVNPYLFNYCLSVAMLHRDDCKGLGIPSLAHTFPDKFVNPSVSQKARSMAQVTGDQLTTQNRPAAKRLPVTIPLNWTASDIEPEQRLAYFREDIGVNLHHWHWHLVYPFDSEDRPEIVSKDRRGELFYYMHQQIIARYNLERLCNDLDLVKPYGDNFRTPIEEAYFPKMNAAVASRAYPSRVAGTLLKDMDRPIDLIKSDISDLESWRDRIITAVDNMSVMMRNGTQMPLTEPTGIDILGNLIEASPILSVNPSFYGDLHNMGHNFTSYAHDPDNRHLERFGVMGDSATAMRDPFFYRWHCFIDNIFNRYLRKLPPYSAQTLNFPSVRISSVSVQNVRVRNAFHTRWQQSLLELGRGLDFSPRGSVLARFTHLQHDDFTYVIEVNNTGPARRGLFRIFLAPVVDSQGHPLSLEAQRRLMIELDKFDQPLSAGQSTVRRSSKDSSVTIPFERTFRDQSQRQGDPGSATAEEFDFCGCGWPHHMLLPRGTTSGFQVVLFVMVSNADEDLVSQDLVGNCNDAASFCGLRDRKYPDKKTMGYPFDRPARSGVNTLAEFLQPNMATVQCSILFNNASPPAAPVS